MAKKIRLDTLLVERGMAEDRSQAQRFVMAGQVLVNGQKTIGSASQVVPDAQIELLSGTPFVSRGGKKLHAAFKLFHLDVYGKVCADVGASTGGFTDCLLQHGAAKVFAIEVGSGILHWKIRQHPQVVVMESVNARYLKKLPEAIDFFSIDASFISLKVLLPVCIRWFGEMGGQAVVLIKPQFEASRQEAAKGKGVIREPEVHRRVIEEVLAFAGQIGYGVSGLAESPVRGPKGNVEFLAHLVYPFSAMAGQDWRAVLDSLFSPDHPTNPTN